MPLYNESGNNGLGKITFLTLSKGVLTKKDREGNTEVFTCLKNVALVNLYTKRFSFGANNAEEAIGYHLVFTDNENGEKYDISMTESVYRGVIRSIANQNSLRNLNNLSLKVYKKDNYNRITFYSDPSCTKECRLGWNEDDGYPSVEYVMVGNKQIPNFEKVDDWVISKSKFVKNLLAAQAAEKNDDLPEAAMPAQTTVAPVVIATPMQQPYVVQRPQAPVMPQSYSSTPAAKDDLPF